MSIIILASLVIIILVIIFSVTLTMKGEEVTMFKLRSLYLYLVSFVSLMMILMGVIFTVQNITDVMFPTNYYYEPYPTDKLGELSEEEQQKYEETQERYQDNLRVESKKNVAKSVAVVIVALPTFIYHWRKVEKEKNEEK